MGISGLLPFLKKASRPVHVSEFKNSTVAIDVYCWLHKGAFGCAEKLVKGQKTDGYIVYVMKYVDLLLFHNIKPVLVFDGRNLPSKSETEKKRRENRAKYKKMARDYLIAGQVREARECFQRCIDITPEMAREVIQACQERNIDCIVAPYEADAQLAFLHKTGLVDLIISEDSDLTLFGCDRILFKLDMNGNGVLVEMAKLNACLGNKSINFTLEKFRYMCIMSGCDYLASLHGIGLGKACKFWSRVTNLDLAAVLPKIPSYLNMHQLNVTQEYIEGFIQANQTFLYQLVFDPKLRHVRPLNDYPDGLTARDLPFCGNMLDPDIALGLSLGNVDLHSLDKVNDFDPDRPVYVDKPRFGRRVDHASIWQGEKVVMMESKKKNDNEEILNCFSSAPKKVTPKSPATKKRKRVPSPPIVCTPEKICKILDSNDDEEVIAREYSKKKVVVHKSRFFKKKQTAGDWLDELEDTDPVKNQLNYRPDVVSENVLKKAFKPVVMQREALPSEDLARKRNPFAIKTPEKKAKLMVITPEKKATLIDIEPEEDDRTPAKIAGSPLKIHASQLKVSAVLRSNVSPPAPLSDTSPETKSSYFSTEANTTPSNSSWANHPLMRGPRGISGLLKTASNKRK